VSSRQFVLPIVLTLLGAAMVVGVGFAEVLPIDMFDGGGGEGSAEVAASPEVSAEVAVEVEAGLEASDHADRLDVAAAAGADDDRMTLTLVEDHEEIGKAEEGNLLSLLSMLSIAVSGDVSGDAGTEASADRQREPETAAESGTPERADVGDGTE